MIYTEEDVYELANNVTMVNDCRLWCGPRGLEGKPLIEVSTEDGVRVMRSAELVAYKLAFGEIPSGPHRKVCDRTLCINPNHLAFYKSKEYRDMAPEQRPQIEGKSIVRAKNNPSVRKGTYPGVTYHRGRAEYRAHAPRLRRESRTIGYYRDPLEARLAVEGFRERYNEMVKNAERFPEADVVAFDAIAFKSPKRRPYLDVQMCWEWQGEMVSGVPALHCKETSYKAVTLAYELEYGPLPEGNKVIQTCGNGLCINYRHLWADTK